MRSITLAVPLRRSRREHRGPGGPRTDLRSTLRQARRTGGYAFRLISRAPSRRPRRLVVLCDISGSMEPYARAMIQLLYCAAGGARAEVFTFATRLTRLTPALSRTLPGRGAAARGRGRAGLARRDQDRWSIKEFNDVYGRRGMARGAIVVIISDGWDTGDPEVLRREMERLSLVAFRIVWVNPRTKSASYQPLAGGHGRGLAALRRRGQRAPAARARPAGRGAGRPGPPPRAGAPGGRRPRRCPPLVPIALHSCRNVFEPNPPQTGP